MVTTLVPEGKERQHEMISQFSAEVDAIYTSSRIMQEPHARTVRQQARQQSMMTAAVSAQSQMHLPRLVVVLVSILTTLRLA